MSEPAATDSGIVALGDSITVAEGDVLLGRPCRSWALWLAGAMDVPFTSYAVNGARTVEVLREQLPRVRRSYGLGLLYAGVNDVRRPDFDHGAWTMAYGRLADALARRCARTALVTIPVDLGRPRAGAGKVQAANATIRAAAEETGATVVALDDLRGRRFLLPDAVHPTALGQLEIADRAAAALSASGTPVPRPSSSVGGLAFSGADGVRLPLELARPAARGVVQRTVQRLRG